MQFLVCKNIVFFLVTWLMISSTVVHSYEMRDCLHSSFNSEVKHAGWPFGLHEVILKINKEKCLLHISHLKLKWIRKNWSIDVCRGPIHIKMGLESVEVIKRKSRCSDAEEDTAFCSRYKELTSILQDDGLIFASGQKENIDSDHGRLDCSFQLIKQYLNAGNVFSLTDKKQAQLAPIEKNNFNSQLVPSEDKSQSPIPVTGEPADF